MKKNNIVVIISFFISLAILILFQIPGIILSSDVLINDLLKEIISRTTVGIFLIILLVLKNVCNLSFKLNEKKDLLWLIPALFVAIANFPFSALITGLATIERVELIPLLLLKCFTVGLVEDLLFVGLFRTIICEILEKKNTKHLTFYTILLTALLFGLSHLFNLAVGASIPSTLLQVGYTFLMGALFTTIFIKTKNIWFSVIIHALFDFGGMIVLKLGSGPFQDIIFWIMTIVFGLIAGIHILYTIYKMDKEESNEKQIIN